MQVKYFDRKRQYDDYKKKLEEEGYQPIEVRLSDLDGSKR